MSDTNDKDTPKAADEGKAAEDSKADAGATNGGGAAAAAAASAAAQGTPAGAGGAGAQTAPRFQALAQYIRDLSVENPNAPDSFRNKNQPKIDVNVSVGVNPKAEGTHEVVLKLEAKAGSGKDMLFAVELAYAGLFRLQNMTQEQGQVALMIEAPRLLFPFAREILANATRQAGFPPLMLDPVDFLALYRQRAMQAQKGGARPTAS